MLPSTLLIASHNAGKVAEFAALLSPLGIRVISASDLGIDEPEETGSSFADNAELKAMHSTHQTGHAVLADDSGLVVDALGGAPGIYSARWAGPDKNWGTAFARIEKELLAAQGTTQNMRAAFVCDLCLSMPGSTARHFEGRIEGTLRFPPSGNKGFGYDPIFVPDGYNVTFAELASEEKNRISHRAIAVEKFLTYLKGLS